MAMTKKMAERIQAGLKRFLPVLTAQRDRDVSEADTITLVKDLLSEVFAYDKYAELTSEHAIRGTYCDLMSPRPPQKTSGRQSRPTNLPTGKQAPHTIVPSNRISHLWHHEFPRHQRYADQPNTHFSRYD